MESALVTVIVPIYNVAVYMDRCVDSIVTQTHSKLDIILVDDGSTDGSGDLCDSWAVRDPRIRVIHQPNAGLSMARNAALDSGTASYITMVDGDDYLAPHAIETMLKLMKKTRAQIVAAAWRTFDDGTEPPITTAPGRITIYNTREAIDDVFYQHTVNNSSCSKLFTANIFDTLRYPQGMLYEDLAVIYDILQQATTVAHTTAPLYFYRQRRGSITATFSERRTHVLDILEALEQRVAVEAPHHLKAVRSRLLSAYFNILRLLPRNHNMAHVETRCWQGILRLRRDCLLDPHVRLKNKAGILLSLLGPQALRLFK